MNTLYITNRDDLVGDVLMYRISGTDILANTVLLISRKDRVWAEEITNEVIEVSKNFATYVLRKYRPYKIIRETRRRKQ